MSSVSTPGSALRSLAVAGGLLTFALIVGFLYFAQGVVVPVALAIMLAFVLNPIVMLLQRWRLGRVPAVISTVVLTGVLAGGFIWLVSLQLTAFVKDLPKYESNVRTKVAKLREAGQSNALNNLRASLDDITRSGDEAGAKEGPGGTAQTPTGSADIPGPLQALSPAFEALGKFFFSLILAIFMLMSREDIRNRLVSFMSQGSLTTTTKALDDAGQRISRYMITQLIVNGCFGAAIGFGLFLLGIPYFLLCGLCAGILRYIPYAGILIAGVAALAVSFVTSSSWTGMLFVLILFGVLEGLTANVIEPWLYGQGTGVSAVALLICAAFWAWLWGPVGLILTTPLTVCLVVAGKYVPSLAFFDKLLGDRPALKPYAVYLQRLLARDPLEAASVVRKYREQNVPERVYDGLFVPALILARQDRSSGAMTATEADSIVRETATLIRQIGSAAAAKPGLEEAIASQPPDSHERIIGLPAHDEMDELTLMMLNQLVIPSGFQLEVGSTRTLPSEMISHVGRQLPRVVVIAAMPPGGLPQASYLCEELRKNFPRLGIIVGYWGYDSNLDEVIVGLRAAGATYVTTTLQGARSHILSMCESSPSLRSYPIPDSPEVRLSILND